jgi:hypothetical protein
VYKILLRKSNGKTSFAGLGIDGRIILKRITKTGI